MFFSTFLWCAVFLKYLSKTKLVFHDNLLLETFQFSVSSLFVSLFRNFFFFFFFAVASRSIFSNVLFGDKGEKVGGMVAKMDFKSGEIVN